MWFSSDVGTCWGEILLWLGFAVLPSHLFAWNLTGGHWKTIFHLNGPSSGFHVSWWAGIVFCLREASYATFFIDLFFPPHACPEPPSGRIKGFGETSGKVASGNRHKCDLKGHLVEH